MSTNTHNNLIEFYSHREERLLTYCMRKKLKEERVNRLLQLSANRLMLAEELGRALGNKELMNTRLNNGLRVSL